MIARMRISFPGAAAALALAACSASGVDRNRSGQIAGPSARAYSYVVISVADMQEALDLWESRLGMEVAVSRRGADPGLSRIWGLAGDAIAEQVLLNTPGVIDGGVHLVRFADPGHAVSEGAGPIDLGPRGLVLGVRDPDARRSELLAAGAQPRPAAGESTRPEAGRPSFEVHDGIELTLQNDRKSALPFAGSGYAVALQMLALVPDAEREAAFFANVLGLDRIATSPAGEAGAGVLLLGARDSRFGRLELVEYAGSDARDLYRRTAPPARGILSLTYVVPDLAPILERGRAAGIADHGPVRSILGDGRMASVTSPAGLRIDFVQL